jgi:hypothetical protein
MEKKITKGQAEAFLRREGFPELFVQKAEGVFYLCGGHEDQRINQTIERCLHVIRWSDLTFDTLRWKLKELTHA